MEILKTRDRILEAGLNYWKLCSNREHQTNWMVDKIRRASDDQLISEPQSLALEQIANEKRVGRYLFDLAATYPVLETVPVAFNLALAYCFRDNPLIGAELMVGPVSTSGIFRVAYTALRCCQESISDRNLKPVRNRSLGFLLAPWNIIGIFSLPTQIWRESPELSSFLIHDLVARKGRFLSVFGQRGLDLANKITQSTQGLVDRHVQ